MRQNFTDEPATIVSLTRSPNCSTFTSSLAAWDRLMISVAPSAGVARAWMRVKGNSSSARSAIVS